MLSTLMPSLHELINADYKVIKNDESERIISLMLTGLKPVKTPQLWQISGIPGAGKSTFCKLHLPVNCLLLSFDAIMLSLSGYQKMLKEKGAVAAYQAYEMPARIIGYEVLRRAVAKKLNIMFEHSGANKAHLELFKNISQYGYKTAVNFIICNTDLAISRAAQREKQTNRHVPKQLIAERAEKIKEYIKSYQQITPQIAFFDGENNFQLLKKI